MEIPASLTSRYSAIPSRPPSRPSPLSCMPPNEAAATVRLISLMPTMAKRSLSSRRVAREISHVYILGCKSVIGILGHGQSLFFGIKSNNRSNRPESLLAVDKHLRGNIVQKRRRIEKFTKGSVFVGVLQKNHCGALPHKYRQAPHMSQEEKQLPHSVFRIQSSE